MKSPGSPNEAYGTNLSLGQGPHGVSQDLEDGLGALWRCLPPGTWGR